MMRAECSEARGNDPRHWDESFWRWRWRLPAPGPAIPPSPEPQHHALLRAAHWLGRLAVEGQQPGRVPFLVSPAPRHPEEHLANPLGQLLRPHPLQEAVDDILSALKLDPSTVVPEIRSLKPEAQALVTQGLSSRCRALLSQEPDARAPLSDEDARGLIAAGEALIEIDGGQLSWYLLLADVLTAAGTRGLGLGDAGVRLLSLLVLFCKMKAFGAS